jgi:hypothetical protein
MKSNVEFEKTFCDGETAKAIHVRFEDGKLQWIPKSIIDDDSEVYEKGHEGTLIIPEWFALREGLI